MVKKIIVFAESLSGNGEVLDSFKESVQEFDSNQNLLAERAFIEDGSLSFARTFKYDENGVLIEKLEYMDFEQVGETTTYSYDENGELIETVTMFMDGAKTIQKSARDGNLITILQTDENDIVEANEVKRLDEHENIVEEIAYGPDNEVISRQEHTYNSLHQAIDSKQYEYGEFVTHRRCEYDDNDGNLIKQETLNPIDGLMSSMAEYVYGEDGLLLTASSFDIGGYGGRDLHRSGGQHIKRIYEYEFFDE